VALKPLPGMLDGQAKSKPGSTRIIVSGVQAHILHSDESLAGPNEVGELHVRGGTAVLGYEENIKVIQETFVMDGCVWATRCGLMRMECFCESI
jgi:acyl-CoA synthetase (AMP-forming)/AMP-acid ligase II